MPVQPRLRPLALGCALLTCFSAAAGDNLPAFGPLYQEFRLTLEPGERTEALGPLFYTQQSDATRTWAVPPVFSYTSDPAADTEQFDFLYPLLTYDRYGTESRWQLFQLLSLSGGQTAQTNVQRFTLFPLFFYQHSDIPSLNYWGVFPIYGRLKNRLFRDEIEWVLFPLYSKTVRSRPFQPLPPAGQGSLFDRFWQPDTEGVTTFNVLYPIFHYRTGPRLRGWQVWPLVGYERKEVTFRTNHWNEIETIGGHRRFFALWPLYLEEHRDIGTEDAQLVRALLPFFSATRSPKRDSTTAPWPFGITYTEDREKNYREWGAPWPLVVFARGPGKYANRVFPFFSHARNASRQSDFYLWPVYKYSRLHGESLDRERTRILLFLYSALKEQNLELGTVKRRRDLWPLYTWRCDAKGNRRLQILAPLEPLLPNSPSIERNYSQVWALWRQESNASTGANSQSLLWNLYRRERTTTSKKVSLLFGLFQYQTSPEGRRWRVFYIPFGGGRSSAHTAGAAP